MIYEVLVDNIGKVHEGRSRIEADNVFDEYIKQSMLGAGETVTMLCDGEICKEHRSDLRLARNPARRSSLGNTESAAERRAKIEAKRAAIAESKAGLAELRAENRRLTKEAMSDPRLRAIIEETRERNRRAEHDDFMSLVRKNPKRKRKITKNPAGTEAIYETLVAFDAPGAARHRERASGIGERAARHEEMMREYRAEQGRPFDKAIVPVGAYSIAELGELLNIRDRESLEVAIAMLYDRDYLERVGNKFIVHTTISESDMNELFEESEYQEIYNNPLSAEQKAALNAAGKKTGEVAKTVGRGFVKALKATGAGIAAGSKAAFHAAKSEAQKNPRRGRPRKNPSGAELLAMHNDFVKNPRKKRRVKK